MNAVDKTEGVIDGCSEGIADGSLVGNKEGVIDG